MIWHPKSTAPKDGTMILAWWVGTRWPEIAIYRKQSEQWICADGYSVDGFDYWTPITIPEGEE